MFISNLKNHPHVIMMGEEFEPGGGESEAQQFAEELENSSQPNEATEPTESNPFIPQEDNSNQGGNPAWSSVLNEIPEEFHNKITPHLSEWDKNYHSGLEKARNEVQSQYEPFNAFLENGIDPEELQRSYQIYQAIENNPEGVIAALQEAAGLSGQGDDDDDTYDANDISNDPRYQELESKFDQFREAFETKEQEKQFMEEQAQMVDEITNELEGLSGQFEQAFGFEMDPEEVLRIAIQDAEENDTEINLMGAAQHFAETINRYRTPQPQNGFKAMPASGGIPSTQQDVKNLSDEESKNLMIEMLRNSQGGN